jgi:hypothetical protein
VVEDATREINRASDHIDQILRARQERQEQEQDSDDSHN